VLWAGLPKAVKASKNSTVIFKTRQYRSYICEREAVREGQARRMSANSWVFPEMFRKAKSISSASWR
ncbi:MAG: hypothetical protein WB816_14360, partial [Methylocystis sp.]